MELIPQNILDLGQAVTTAFIIYLIIKQVLGARLSKKETKEYGIYGSAMAQELGQTISKVVMLDSQMIEFKTNHEVHQKEIQDDLKQLKADVNNIKIDIAKITTHFDK